MQPAGRAAPRRPVPTDRPTRRPVTPWRTAASGRRSPPWATLEGCTAGSESFRVYTRSARRRGRWSVHVWSARTHTGVATMVPCTTGARPTHAVGRVHTAYGPPTVPRAWLVCGTHPVAAPRRRRHRHSSHTDCHHCHCQLACPVSLHRYHPHNPLTHRLRHACNWCGCAHVLASLITVYRLRLPLARVLVTHGLL